MAGMTVQPVSDPRKPLKAKTHPSPGRDQSDATIPERAGVLPYLARATRENTRAHGVLFAAHELARTETLLRAFRAQLLTAQPRTAGGDSRNAALMIIELMIAREALSRPTTRQPNPAGARRRRSDGEPSRLANQPSHRVDPEPTVAAPACEAGRRRRRALRPLSHV